jgi:ubiquinone/menaquinone biosynthesis C-methylase UbiE
MVGVDLSAQRLAYARSLTPGTSFCRVGASLPFPQGAFDLVFASLVFSSVGDRQLHAPLAAELERVTKLRGAIVWLDLDRSQGALHGFGIGDIIRLFPSRDAIAVDRLHPRYFRRLHRFRRLMNVAYNLTRAGCESTLYLLVPRDGHGR